MWASGIYLGLTRAINCLDSVISPLLHDHPHGNKRCKIPFESTFKPGNALIRLHIYQFQHVIARSHHHASLWGSERTAPTDVDKGEVTDTESRKSSTDAGSRGAEGSEGSSAARETSKGSTVPSRIGSFFGSFFRGDSPPVKRTFVYTVKGNGNTVRGGGRPGKGQSREEKVHVEGDNHVVRFEYGSSSSSPSPVIQITRKVGRQEEGARSRKPRPSEGSGTESKSGGKTGER
jgi:hypothetical protein